MATIEINQKVYSLPQSWDDMSPRQFVHVISHFINSKDIPTFKLRALFTLLNFQIPNKPTHQREGIALYTIRADKKNTFLLTPQQLAEMLNKVDFMFDTDESGNQTDYILSGRTINPIPSFKVNFIRYYGPADRLYNCSFAEFIEAENNYMNFLNKKDNSFLLKLVASFFRPQDPSYKPNHFEFTGDRREPFNDYILNYRSDKFKHLHPNFIFSIFYWFQGCREFITWQFPHVFGGTASGKHNPFGMMALVDALANNDVTKNDKILKGSLYSILLRLEQSAIARIEAEEKLSKQ